MFIGVETSKQNRIKTEQGLGLTNLDRGLDREFADRFKNARRRTEVSALYNCHGLTFASRRTRIIRAVDVKKILDDDNYQIVTENNILPGDIVLYLSVSGDVNHSGVVVECPLGNAPMVFSKWGNGGEFIHVVRECPELYGPRIEYRRCIHP